MSTGYSWEGIRQVRATLLGARHVPERLCGGGQLGALYQVLDLLTRSGICCTHMATVSEQCFTSLPTQYTLYGRRFLRVKRPNQQYQSTEGDATKEKENNENN